MILSNGELHKAIDDKRLVLTPEPWPRVQTEGMKCPYSTHSVDLRLGSLITVPDLGAYAYDLHFMQPGFLATFISKNSAKVNLPEGATYVLERNRFILTTTLEMVGLPILPQFPNCLAARVEGKSSLARCGIVVHFTAPTVHPGWNGQLTLEIINLGPAHFVMRQGMAIAQLIVEEVKGIPHSESRSQFQGQTSPEGTA